MEYTYTDVTVSLAGVETSINGKAQKVTIQWNTVSSLFTPINTLTTRLQILGNKVGQCTISGIELPSTTASTDMQKINTGPITIAISKGVETLLTITGAFDKEKKVKSEQFDENVSRKILSTELVYNIVEI